VKFVSLKGSETRHDKFLGNVREGRKEGRKKGRKEGRKERRKE